MKICGHWPRVPNQMMKMAFNDYFMKRIVPKKDGGYLLISEAEFTTTRGSAFNRSDYLYGPMSPIDYYSPYYNPIFTL